MKECRRELKNVQFRSVVYGKINKPSFVYPNVYHKISMAIRGQARRRGVNYRHIKRSIREAR